MDIGILLFTGAVAFSVVTLPVEFNASKRALTLLEERRFLTPDEMVGARKVLSAAALTYVASTAMAAVQLLAHVSDALVTRLARRRRAGHVTP